MADEALEKDRQAAALTKANALYALRYVVTFAAGWAADCYAYANGHPDALPWERIANIPSNGWITGYTVL